MPCILKSLNKNEYAANTKIAYKKQSTVPWITIIKNTKENNPFELSIYFIENARDSSGMLIENIKNCMVDYSSTIIKTEQLMPIFTTDAETISRIGVNGYVRSWSVDKKYLLNKGRLLGMIFITGMPRSIAP